MGKAEGEGGISNGERRRNSRQIKAQGSKLKGKNRNGNNHLKPSNSINGHPDEIEKKKHFIGQADPHGRTQTGPSVVGGLRL